MSPVPIIQLFLLASVELGFADYLYDASTQSGDTSGHSGDTSGRSGDTSCHSDSEDTFWARDGGIIAVSILAAISFIVLIVAVCILIFTLMYWRKKTKGATSNKDKSLLSHDYDTPYTSARSSRSSSLYSRLRSSLPPSPEQGTKFMNTEANDDRSQGNRGTPSNSDSLLESSKAINVAHTSYGAVDSDAISHDGQYGYVNMNSARGRPTSSSSIRPRVSSRRPPRGYMSEDSNQSTYNSIVTTTHSDFTLQSLKHSMSGYHVPSAEQRRRDGGQHEMTEAINCKRLDFFDVSKAYWSPSSTTDDLYSQLSTNKYREIPQHQLLILEQIGSGHFGTVSKGMWTCEGESMLVAVKTLKSEASEEEKVKFLQEAALMGQFSHLHIIRIFGVVTVTLPTLIVLELATSDLREYLKNIRLGKQFMDYLPSQFLRFGLEIAQGMCYLSNKGFVHRDLAARNILLDSMLTCKIGDFGMARDLMDESVYTSTGASALPVKWMAPEALMYRSYSTASDVWSFGMVLFEIWSVGLKPFHDLTNRDALERIQDNYCLPPPPGCPRAVYKIMIGCWNPESKCRPSFNQVYHRLSQPEEYLLCQSEECTAAAAQLGADLIHSQHLYLDLQRQYHSEA